MIKCKYFLFIFVFIFISESLYAANKGGRNLPSRRVPQQVNQPNKYATQCQQGLQKPQETRKRLTDLSERQPSTVLDVSAEPGLTKHQMKLTQNPKYNIIDAVYENELEIARFLIRSGKDIDVRDEVGRTPLMIAASREDIEMAQLLLSEGKADAKARDNENRTALHYTKNNELARALILELGADVNARDSEDRTPLHYAQNIDVARVFVVEFGADLNAKDVNGQIPPLSSIDIDIVDFLEGARSLYKWLNNDRDNNNPITIPDFILYYVDTALQRVTSGEPINAPEEITRWLRQYIENAEVHAYVRPNIEWIRQYLRDNGPNRNQPIEH